MSSTVGIAPPPGFAPAVPVAAAPAPQPPQPPPVAAPAPAPPSVAAPAPRWSLRLADGTSHPADRAILIGREPDAQLMPGALLVTVADSDGTVSRSHAVIEPVEGALRVRDVSSTNGVVVLYPDGREVEVTAGASVIVDGPCEIELGALAIQLDRR